MCQIWFFYWEIFDHCLEFFLHLEKEFGTGQSGLNDKNTPKVETTVWPFCAKGQKGWRTGGQKGWRWGSKGCGAPCVPPFLTLYFRENGGQNWWRQPFWTLVWNGPKILTTLTYSQTIPLKISAKYDVNVVTNFDPRSALSPSSLPLQPHRRDLLSKIKFGTKLKVGANSLYNATQIWVFGLKW